MNGEPFNCRHLAGQGATEYLVVLGTVLIISLVAISLLGGTISSSSGTKETSSNMYWQGQAKPFRISEAALTNDSKLVFTMENSEADPITLTRITMGGAGTGLSVDGTNAAFGEGTNYANNSTVYFGAGEKKQVGIDFGAGKFNCGEGKLVTTSLVLTYRTQNGIEKTEASGNGFSIRCNMNSGSYSAGASCKPSGQSCSSTSDCCSMLKCSNSTCFSVASCQYVLQDCSSDNDCCGFCAIYQNNPVHGFCTRGFSYCNTNLQCDSGRCVVEQNNPDYGTCTDGAAGHRCNTNSQCNSGQCVITYNNPDYGTCTDGAVEDICKTNSQCNSGQCILFHNNPDYGTCTDGADGYRCNTNSQCDSGRCAILANNPDNGRCTTGAVWMYCNTNSQCDSGRCTITQNNPDVGFCTTGAVGSYCNTNLQCDSGQCVITHNNPDYGLCN